MRKILMLLTTICIATTLVACGGNKESVKTATDKPSVTDTKEVQANGLTKEEEENAKKITVDFATALLNVNYNEDTEETYNKWLSMISESTRQGFDENFVKSSLQDDKDNERIIKVTNIDITSVKKEDTKIKVEYTVAGYTVHSKIVEENEKNITAKCTLTIEDKKISSFKTESV
ncbi:hypothetical protein [Clostridium intestinale]|uniref:Lipoprotein n=1 Tax=Clostridium intestinale DSM 6191 TaxID=1121320 RepID=A0A1M5ZR67_9CLOT|nr:hypothetical protein [Clostridium intestinale]SHI26586.1 hypothetical protein SAMN02745941_03267 [Clostridium intestinale DSM 6191]